jgi:RNase H-fold protein (predicted Holliday junction resolvase)
MIAGIDVGQKTITIAYHSSSGSGIPIFEKIYRKDDKSTSAFLCKKLIKEGINKVAFESPEELEESKIIRLDGKGISIVCFLKEFRRICRKVGIRTIPVDPRGTSKICPRCKKKLEVFSGSAYLLHCPFCRLTLDRDKIASWNILNRGIKKFIGKNG